MLSLPLPWTMDENISTVRMASTAGLKSSCSRRIVRTWATTAVANILSQFVVYLDDGTIFLLNLFIWDEHILAYLNTRLGDKDLAYKQDEAASNGLLLLVLRDDPGTLPSSER